MNRNSVSRRGLASMLAEQHLTRRNGSRMMLGQQRERLQLQRQVSRSRLVRLLKLSWLQ